MTGIGGVNSADFISSIVRINLWLKETGGEVANLKVEWAAPSIGQPAGCYRHFFRIGEVVENSYRVAPSDAVVPPVRRFVIFLTVKPSFVLLDPN